MIDNNLVTINLFFICSVSKSSRACLIVKEISAEFWELLKTFKRELKTRATAVFFDRQKQMMN